MGIRGIPIPYGAPNAAAHIERLIGTLRRECLDRMLIWNNRHLRCVLTEFIRWYNHGCVHQGLNGIPDPDPAIEGPKPLAGRLVAIPVLSYYGIFSRDRGSHEASDRKRGFFRLSPEVSSYFVVFCESDRDACFEFS
jgi:hypothetical protein